MTETKSTNIKWHIGHVDREYRMKLLGQKGFTIWFTGLPSSGKSTTAFTLEHSLVSMCKLTYVLDGDNIRHGLNKNLSFSLQDREENIRRIGEVAKLFADAGVITLTSFISPYRKDRDLVRKLHEEANLDFIEAYIATPVSVCADRDPKKLYERASKGEIKGFTGVDDPYEAPQTPEIILDTLKYSPEECTQILLDYLRDRGLLPNNGNPE